MRSLKTTQGQFLPISAMAMLTIVVFLVAVVNVYQVTQTKLKVQNLADAVALNIASQEAQSINTVADRNEWLNHLYSDSQGSSTPGSNPCNYNQKTELPGLSCVYSGNPSNFKFNAMTSAQHYASLVKEINDAQQLFTSTYNNFIGAGTGNTRSLQEILMADITELQTDPTIRIITWNSSNGQQQADTQQQQMMSSAGQNQSNSNLITAYMQPLNFNVADVKVDYLETKFTPLPTTKTTQATFASLLKQTDPVGWYELPSENDLQAMPRLKVNVGTGKQSQYRIGAGAYVIKTLNVLGMVPVAISARAVAYVVDDSGSLPVTGQPISGWPKFSPTYWVKLGR